MKQKYWSRVIKEENERGDKWDNACNGRRTDSVQQVIPLASLTGEASGNRRVQAHGSYSRQRAQSSSTILRNPTQTDGRKPYKYGNGESPSSLKGRTKCQDLLKGKCTERSCGVWDPLVSLVASLNPDASMVTVVNSHTLRLVCSPEKSKKRRRKRTSGFIDRDYSVGGKMKNGNTSRSQVLQDHSASRKTSGKEGSIAGHHSIVRSSGSKIHGLPNSRKERKTAPSCRRGAPAETLGWELANHVYKVKKESK